MRGYHDAAGERTQATDQRGGEKQTGATEHDGIPGREVLQCAVAQIMKTSLNFAFIGILVSAVAMVIVSAATKKKGTIVADAE